MSVMSDDAPCANCGDIVNGEIVTYVGDGSTIPALAFLSGYTKFTVNLKGNFAGSAPAAWQT